jgi:hypothetical protein
MAKGNSQKQINGSNLGFEVQFWATEGNSHIFFIYWKRMLTGEIRSRIDAFWNAIWTGGISNPLEVIEQIATFQNGAFRGVLQLTGHIQI